MSLIQKTLTDRFCLNKFRTGQEDIIQKLIDGKSVIVTMPTGSGKSLCYQLPALLLDGVTLIISPLIALMKDQVDALDKLGIPSTFINSTLSQNETLQRFSLVENNAVKLLYVAPERFYSNAFINLLKGVKVSLFIVDEAHCISQWGHDFRPSYMQLKNVISIVGNPPVGAFTATATPEVRKDIHVQLGFKSVEEIVTGFDRKNLKYVSLSLKNDEEKQGELLSIISRLKGSGIIYTGTKKLTNSLTDTLLNEGYSAAGYHGGMEKDDREFVQNNWISGKTKIIVATNAFGMGIDKPDVRFVFHYSMPGTIEAFMQESGRAGRDGKTSYCVAFTAYSDVRLHEFFIDNAHPTKDDIIKVYNFLHSQGTPDIYLTTKEIADKTGTGIKDIIVGPILIILERAKLLKRLNRHDHQMEIKLLKKDVELRGQNQKSVFKYILEASNKDSFPVLTLSPEEVMNVLDMTQTQLSASLMALDSKEIIDYTPPFRGRGIRLMGEKISTNKLSIDFSAIEKHHLFQMEKLEIMKGYFKISSCRRQYLLSYFGENLSEPNCRGCDICLNWRPKISIKNKKTSDNSELISDIINLADELKGQFGRDGLSKTLAGSNSTKLHGRLKNHVLFGKYDQVTHKYISSVFDELIDEGYLRRGSGMYPTLQLTIKGQDVQKGTNEIPPIYAQPKPAPRKSNGKLSMTASLQITWELFQQNLLLKEMAQQRDYATSTITNHLCQLIELGKDIDAFKFVAKEKIPIIKDAIQKTKIPSLSAIKSNIPDSKNCSYDDIRFVLEGLKRN